jgi:uncharacterized protein YodC (DUF2158 family)
MIEFVHVDDLVEIKSKGPAMIVKSERMIDDKQMVRCTWDGLDVDERGNAIKKVHCSWFD